MNNTDLVSLLAAIIGGTATIIGALIGKANKKRTIAFCVGGFFIVCAVCLFITGHQEPPTQSPTPEPPSVVSPTPPTETAIVTPSAEPIKGPSKEDVDKYGPGLHYPEESEYLPEYKTQYIRSKSGHSAFTFSSHRKDKIQLYTVLDGEKVTVLAENINNGFSCVIIDSIEKAAWINTDYLFDTPE